MTLSQWIAWTFLGAVAIGFVALFCWSLESIPLGLLAVAGTVIFAGAICWSIITLVGN